MTKEDIHIPPEAVAAALRAYEMGMRNLDHKPLTAAIRAALAAWPGMTTEPRMWRTAIILPITEPRDDAV